MSSVEAIAPRALAAAAPRIDNVPRGILYMVAATAMFAVSNAASKLLVASYPVGEVMAARSLGSLALCALVVLPTAGFACFRTARPGAHVARGLSQAVSQTFTVIALSMMPIAGVTAIGFTAPLFAAVVSMFALRERPDGGRLATLAIGFVGALVVTRPGAGAMQIGALFALANAIMYGSVMVAVRGMSKTESTLTLLMWQMATVALFQTPLVALGFETPRLADLGVFAAAGVANGCGQYLWTRALGLAPASAVSPYYYMLLVWSLALGWALWGDVPTLTLLVGSAIVAGAGLALLWRATTRARLASRGA